MRVLCRHGHFAFYPRTEKDVARFASFYDLELVRAGDFYTFPRLAEAKDYSIQGRPYLNLPALATFEGLPWEVMKENGYVYQIASDLLVPATSILIKINPPQVGYFFLGESPLIQPGSLNAAGQRILSYDGEFVQNTFQLRVSGFDYE